MKLSNVIGSAKSEKYLIISKDELDDLLSLSQILLEENTFISGSIRLLKYRSDFFIQEKTTNDEFLIRMVKTKKDGEVLIKQRLEIYEKMWDGCGCKVDYYN